MSAATETYGRQHSQKFQDAGKGIIGLMTGLLGLYMTAAMWVEFNEALGFYFGHQWVL